MVTEKGKCVLARMLCVACTPGHSTRHFQTSEGSRPSSRGGLLPLKHRGLTFTRLTMKKGSVSL